jgi:hypothetical protein
MCAVRGAHGLLFIAFPIGCLDLLCGAFLCDWSAWPSPTLLWDPSQGECCMHACFVWSLHAPAVLLLLLVLLLLSVHLCV